jgi:putative lipoprotein
MTSYKSTRSTVFAAFIGSALCIVFSSFNLYAVTGFIEGEAFYLEALLPPPNATFTVFLQDTSRADAPAIEHAKSSQRLSGGPPYAWRLAYDPLSADLPRLTIRATITTPEGLWMTTDTKVLAMGAAQPLQTNLRQRRDPIRNEPMCV